MKVIISDDQAIVREGLELLLKLEKDIEVVGLAQDGAEVIDLAARRLPDLILMDLKMPGINGVEATRRICAASPQVKILVLTTFDDDEWVFDAIRVGSPGYLLKDTPHEDVIRAIRGTVLGKAYLDPQVAGKLINQVASQKEQPQSLITAKLTGREADVLHLIARGLSNAEIAEQLHISEGTVRNHVSAIFAKLHVSDRTQAAILAIRHGMD